jgi:hypothetical protein
MGRMYRLCLWVQYMQGSTTTILTAKHPVISTESLESIAKISHFFHLSFIMKARVKRSWEGYTGCVFGSNTFKGQLKHY